MRNPKVSIKQLYIFAYNEIQPLIQPYNKDKIKIELAGFRFKINSLRLNCLKLNPTCISCGITGNFFILEQPDDQPSPHLNLYYINPLNKSPILLTKDHIIPLSKKGKNNLSNLQTMCIYCNAEKSNSIL